jgi:ribose transport system ATP-binding protein
MTNVTLNHSILEMKAITKRFPGVLALDNVDFSVRRGEVHSLIGQNGAGKSTLVKILAGDYPPTSGEIRIDGIPVTFNHPRESQTQGVAIVYQELSLLPNLTVAENIFLGREPGNYFIIDNNKILSEARKVLAQLGISTIDLNKKVAELPLAQQQLVEIAKALSHEPRILILDEPTAALAPNDADRLFEILTRLKAQDIAIIYITHRLKEIIDHCDMGTVLRNGKLVQTVKINNGMTEDNLIELMIGQEVESYYRFNEAIQQDESLQTLLEVDTLSINDKVRDISFKLNRGEILGVTGLLGAGQNELARSLFGIQPGVSGKIKRNGKQVKISSPKEALNQGICLLTENRKEEGLFLDMTVKENITMPSLSQFVISRRIPFLDNRIEKQAAKSFIDRVNIILRSPEVRVRTLSGGNQQKSILARWLLRDLEILVFIEPTRGIDVGAKSEIYRYLDKLAKDGRAILVVSPELIEILGISDRIIVMHEGKLVQEFQNKDVTEEQLLGAIQGATTRNNHSKGILPNGNTKAEASGKTAIL